MHPALFFLLKIAVTLQGLCGFIHVLGLLFLFLCKMHWDFNEDCTESIQMALGKMNILTILILLIREQGIFFHLFVSSSVFFSSVLYDL